MVSAQLDLKHFSESKIEIDGKVLGNVMEVKVLQNTQMPLPMIVLKLLMPETKVNMEGKLLIEDIEYDNEEYAKAVYEYLKKKYIPSITP